MTQAIDTPAVAIPPRLIGTRDTAKLLGISERTLYTLAQGGRIPRVRIGGRVFYDVDDLRAFVDSHRETAKAS